VRRIGGAEAFRDVFSAFGPVTIKRMFGGKGIYADGLIIAAVMEDGLRLKADALTEARFEAAGCRKWIYEVNGKVAAMPYWTVPDAALDDPEEMAVWARLALDASRRAESAKAVKTKRPTKKPATSAGSKIGQ
jgi:DNA transformation protein and related proteins